jgi:hypothetical protein
MIKRSSRACVSTVIALLFTLIATGGESGIPQPHQRSTDPAPDLTIVDLALVAAGTEDLAGRPVYLRTVRVLRLADTHGFFLDAQAGAVYVLPESAAPAMVAAGDMIDIQGVLAKMPELIPGQINPPLGWNQRIYVMATKITK